MAEPWVPPFPKTLANEKKNAEARSKCLKEKQEQCGILRESFFEAFDELTRESVLPDLTGAERDTMCVGWSQDVVSWHGGPTRAGHPPSHFG